MSEVKRYDMRVATGSVESYDSATLEYDYLNDQIEYWKNKSINITEQRNELAVENAGLNKFITQSCYVFDGEQHEISDAYICATDGGMPETQTTDAFLNDVLVKSRKEGAYFVANRMLAAWDAGFIDDTAKNAADIARMILTSTEFMAAAPEGDFDRSFADGVLEDIAAQIRKGVQS
jgi:hypothetical protein|nr:MAG TPA: hypothetical protein [Caudoviricetes sp.]